MKNSQVNFLFARIEVSRSSEDVKAGELMLVYPQESLVKIVSIDQNQSGFAFDRLFEPSADGQQALPLGVIKRIELVPERELTFDPKMKGKELPIHGNPHLIVNGVPQQIVSEGDSDHQPIHFADLSRFQQAALLHMLVQYEGLFDEYLYEEFEEDGIFDMSDDEFATYRQRVLRAWGERAET